MRYIDMHCDTLGSALAQKTETFLELDRTMVDGLRLQQAEAGAQFFAMFLPQRNDPDWFGLEEMPPAEALMRKMYDIFRHTMEQCSDRFAAAHNAEELKQNPPMADAYIAGSDQIWNTFSNNGKEPGYYLDFGNDQTKRFSYAASLATNSIKDECKDFIKEKLAKFSSISVREKTGASLLADLGISNVSVVLDPVFLLDKSEWKQLSLKGNLYGLSHESYVLVYDFLGNDDNMISFVKAYAKEKSLKIVSINDFSKRGYADININNAGPLEFLSLIDNAACVVASSFHATAFSVIFEKEFYTFNLKGHNNSSRMLDFLSTIGLQDRMNSEDIIDNPIDWKKISSNLLLKLKQSKEFLNQIR